MQKEQWNKEYANKVFLTGSSVPQLDFRNFMKWLKKSQHVGFTDVSALDLGCGNGKNSFYIYEKGAHVTGIDIADTAIKEAKDKAIELNADIDFRVGDIGSGLDFDNDSFDLAIDMLCSNSLTDEKRKNFRSELWRVIKPGAYVFVKVPCLEGDKNAENLLRMFPAKEEGSYIMPKTGITEHVFTKDEILNDYQNYTIHHIEKRASRTIFDGKPYNRKFWVLYLQKPLK